jgi:hypothetical protein
MDKGTETDMSIPMGAGAVVSNPSDLVLFIENLFKKIINESSLNQMTTIQDNYGMGVFQIPFQDKRFGHEEESMNLDPYYIISQRIKWL